MAEEDFDEIKEKFWETEEEIESLDIDVPSKEMIMTYKKDIELLHERYRKCLHEFKEQYDKYDDYQEMLIVKILKRYIDAVELLIPKMRQEIEFLIKILGGRKVEEKDEKPIKEDRKIVDKEIEAIVGMKKQKLSYRDIGEILRMSHQSIKDKYDKWEKEQKKTGEGLQDLKDKT